MIDIDVTTRGEVPDEAREHAVERVGRLERLIDSPQIRAHVVLTEEANPRIERPSRAEAEINLNGPAVRASVADIEMGGAINQLTARLERQLRRLVDRRADRARSSAESAPGEWRHGDLGSNRPERLRRDPEEREIVRRKTFATRPLSVAEAADEMELLDHDFYLFTEVETGTDAVCYHRDDGRIGVIGPRGIGWEGTEDADGIVREETRVSGATALADVLAEMGELNHRFMYFVNESSGRGNAIYLRYDGHYGLIEPAAEGEAAA